MTDYCEGCKTLQTRKFCLISTGSKISKCPCINCLTKSTCRAECNAFVTWIDSHPDELITKMITYCKGCLVFDEHKRKLVFDVYTCELTEFNTNGQCPCVECLIKMICNKACTEYNNWGLRCVEMK